jgi:hypothetical protein
VDAGYAPSLIYTLAFALQLRKIKGKKLRVAQNSWTFGCVKLAAFSKALRITIAVPLPSGRPSDDIVYLKRE